MWQAGSADEKDGDVLSPGAASAGWTEEGTAGLASPVQVGIMVESGAKGRAGSLADDPEPLVEPVHGGQLADQGDPALCRLLPARPFLMEEETACPSPRQPLRPRRLCTTIAFLRGE